VTSSNRRPNRTLGGVHDRFWELCQRQRLFLQRCSSCAQFQWPPEEACEKCGHDRLEWTEVSGRGTLASWCTFVQKYYDALEVPYDTVLVALEEGPLFISNPAGFTNDEARLGDVVEVEFVAASDDAGEFFLPVFARVASQT